LTLRRTSRLILWPALSKKFQIIRRKKLIHLSHKKDEINLNNVIKATAGQLLAAGLLLERNKKPISTHILTKSLKRTPSQKFSVTQ
jgi:hypothetical protein